MNVAATRAVARRRMPAICERRSRRFIGGTACFDGEGAVGFRLPYAGWAAAPVPFADPRQQAVARELDSFSGQNCRKIRFYCRENGSFGGDLRREHDFERSSFGPAEHLGLV